MLWKWHKKAEQLGYKRLWLAEHHNMDGIASSTGFYWVILANTILKVGGLCSQPRPTFSGCNLVLWQPFIRIVLNFGLGRAPGTDQVTMRALRRGRQETEDQFPKSLKSAVLKEPAPHQRIVGTSPCSSSLAFRFKFIQRTT